MSRPYEVLEHTADIGIRARGRTLEETFANMALGMMSLIVPDPRRILEREERRVEARAADLEGLLVAWLSEFVYLVDAERFLAAKIEDVCIDRQEPGQGAVGGDLGVTAWMVTALVRGEGIDPARHPLEMEIKGVSYHMVKVERVGEPGRAGAVGETGEVASEENVQGDGWVAQAIFDI